MNNKRRKELRRAIEIIETALDIVNQVKDEEEDSMCNYPENLQARKHTRPWRLLWILWRMLYLI